MTNLLNVNNTGITTPVSDTLSASVKVVTNTVGHIGNTLSGVLASLTKADGAGAIDCVGALLINVTTETVIGVSTIAHSVQDNWASPVVNMVTTKFAPMAPVTITPNTEAISVNGITPEMQAVIDASVNKILADSKNSAAPSKPITVHPKVTATAKQDVQFMSHKKVRTADVIHESVNFKAEGIVLTVEFIGADLALVSPKGKNKVTKESLITRLAKYAGPGVTRTVTAIKALAPDTKIAPKPVVTETKPEINAPSDGPVCGSCGCSLIGKKVVIKNKVKLCPDCVGGGTPAASVASGTPDDIDPNVADAPVDEPANDEAQEGAAQAAPELTPQQKAAATRARNKAAKEALVNQAPESTVVTEFQEEDTLV